MSSLWWKTIGQGDVDLVLIHGWGLNAEVWQPLLPELSAHFRVHIFDLPGYGRNAGVMANSVSQMAELILAAGPQRAIWLGWSLGGLIINHIALTHPDRVLALVSVASSPCFAARDHWPGIQPASLTHFQQMLDTDFHQTVERFLALQTLGSEQAGRDARKLREAVLALPVPSVTVLNAGLEILKSVDQREAMVKVELPHWRIYGQLDSLVPRKVAFMLDSLWPHSSSHLFLKAAHAPFLSHPEEFCRLLIEIGQTFQNEGEW